MVALTLYGRRGCHLCEDMKAALQELSSRYPFTVLETDVDDHAALACDLGDKVPVLMHGDQYLCHYRLDEALVAAYLAEIS